MDADKRVSEILQHLDTTQEDIFQSFENAMREIGFDFKTESREVINNISPEMEKTNTMITEIDEEIKAILRESGVPDIKLAWGRIGDVKLPLKQKKRISKLIDTKTRLIDAYFGYYILESVIIKNSDEKFTPHPMLQLDNPGEILKEPWKK